MTTNLPQPAQPGPGRQRRWQWLFAASGLLPVLLLLVDPPDTMLLIYSIFVAGWFGRRRLAQIVRRLRLPAWMLALAATLLVGGLTESLAWAGSYLAHDPNPALLHPQLAYDLLFSPGIYAAWALAWMAAGRRYVYGLGHVFVLQGVYGVFVEQQGAVFIQGLRALPLGLVFWLYVFVVYGSAMGLAVLLWPPGLLATGRCRGWLRIPAVLALNIALTAVTALAWGGLLHPLPIPEPRPIWEAPFW